MRGLFVTGTDTGVGKTILSACLVAAMAAAGEDVRAHKPVVTGLDEPVGDWPADHELLGWVAGMAPEAVAPLRYGPAVSPYLAAELAGGSIDPAAVVARARAAGEGAPGEPILVVEGVGGLLVPIADGFAVCDLARELDLPVLIAARPGLGTINHTLLTLESARAAGLRVAAVVLTPWPERASMIERSNRDAIARWGAVEVVVLAHLLPASPLGPDTRVALGRAGEQLPWEAWIDETRPRPHSDHLILAAPSPLERSRRTT